MFFLYTLWNPRSWSLHGTQRIQPAFFSLLSSTAETLPRVGVRLKRVR